MAGLDPHDRRHGAAVAVVCGARRAAVRARRHAVARLAGRPAVLWRVRRHLHWGCSTPAPRGSRCFSTPRPSAVSLLLPRWVPAERLRGVQWLGLFIAFSGVVLAFSEGFGHMQFVAAHRRRHGAGGRHALGPDHAQRCAPRAWPRPAREKTLFYQVAVTAAVCPVLSLALGEQLGLFVFRAGPGLLDRRCRRWSAPSPAISPGCGCCGTTRPRSMSSFTFLTPLFALVFGVVLLKEPLTAAADAWRWPAWRWASCW